MNRDFKNQLKCLRLAHRLRRDGDAYLVELAKCSSLANQAAVRDLLDPISELLNHIGHESPVNENLPAVAADRPHL